MNTRFSFDDYSCVSRLQVCSFLLRRSVIGDILNLHALPDTCDIISLKGSLRNLDIPDEAIVNLDSLSTILASALDVVNVNVVNQLTEQRSGYPLTNTPSVLRVVLEGVIFFIIVGFMEELLLRGLVLNTFEGILAKSKHKTALAIMISSVFFTAGHIPAFIDQGIVIILFKFIYPLGVGVYFGYLYRKYNNIWVPIIIHAVVDIVCGTIVTFSANESDGFHPATVIIMSALSVFLLVYGIVKIVKLDKELQAERFEV